jgi:hypothetical protein
VTESGIGGRSETVTAMLHLPVFAGRMLVDGLGPV